mmetsp:Transcript_710/g.890  ORF Transcript_710/g.890 Transcript_710/m.890 type:complete len:139 (-) Transcript_710:45-461(-)
MDGKLQFSCDYCRKHLSTDKSIEPFFVRTTTDRQANLSSTVFANHFSFYLFIVFTVISEVSLKKAAIGAIPAAAIASPAFAMDSIVDALPTTSLALEVQFGAYLAVLLGTFLPVLFLVNLYVQTESRKAGKAGGQDSE